MLIYFLLILGCTTLAFALMMAALKFSRYKGEKHSGQCGAECHCPYEKNQTCVKPNR